MNIKKLILIMGVLSAVLLTGCSEKVPDTIALTVEAGADVPEASAFFAEPEKVPVQTPEIGYAPESPVVDTTVPGTLPVTLLYNGTPCESTLTVVDTIAPVLTCPDTPALFLLRGAEYGPEDVVLSVEDATAITFLFGTPASTQTVGISEGTVIARDLGGNTAEAAYSILVVDRILEWEATAEPLTEGLLRAALGLETDPEKPGEELLPGGYVGTVQLELPTDPESADAPGIENGESLTVRLVSRDTTPPEVRSVDVKGWCLTEQPIDAFYSGLKDATDVTVSWKRAPDWSAEGTQNVELLFTDACGNSSTITAGLTLEQDTTPPVIYMARNFYGYAGGTIAYLKEVFAEDAEDPDVVLTVDRSEVNPREEGTYPVTYTAADRAGNSTSVTIELTLIPQRVTDEELDTAARALLEQITNADMTTAEKVLAVFNWGYGKMRYNGKSDKTDFNYEAYRGITTRAGDCYTYYAAAYALLERIEGVEVLSVERYGGKRGGNHYWCLVNIEGTGWYHLDTTNTGPSENWRPFMKTTEELDHWYQYNWSFDESLYPRVATTPFVMG